MVHWLFTSITDILLTYSGENQRHERNEESTLQEYLANTVLANALGGGWDTPSVWHDFYEDLKATTDGTYSIKDEGHRWPLHGQDSWETGTRP